MTATDIRMYLYEYETFLKRKNTDRYTVVLAALMLEEAFGIFIRDEEMNEENLGSVERITGFIARRLGSEGPCAVSAE